MAARRAALWQPVGQSAYRLPRRLCRPRCQPGEEADVVPARFKQAIKLYCEALYDRDEKMMEKLIEVAQNLIRPERCDLQMA